MRAAQKGEQTHGGGLFQAPHLFDEYVLCGSLSLTGRHTGILFGCFGRKIDGDSWFTVV